MNSPHFGRRGVFPEPAACCGLVCGPGCVPGDQHWPGLSVLCVGPGLYFSPAREDGQIWGNLQAQPLSGGPSAAKRDCLQLPPGLAPPSLFHGIGSSDPLGTTPYTSSLLSKLWDLGLHLKEGFSPSRNVFCRFFLSSAAGTSSLHFFQPDLHSWEGMSVCPVVPGVGLSYPASHCLVAQRCFSRRNERQPQVAFVSLEVDCPHRYYYYNSAARRWATAYAGRARRQGNGSSEALLVSGGSECSGL